MTFDVEEIFIFTLGIFSHSHLSGLRSRLSGRRERRVRVARVAHVGRRASRTSRAGAARAFWFSSLFSTIHVLELFGLAYPAS